MSQYRLIPILDGKGHQVSIPADPACAYDLVVDNGQTLQRVQVKSCNSKRRNRYRVDIACGTTNCKRPYSDNAFDLFVVHIPEVDVWYVIPLRDVVGQRWISVNPDKSGKYERYRDAWELLSRG